MGVFSNPILSIWLQRQWRWRRLHQSSVLSAILALAMIAGMLHLGARTKSVIPWVKLSTLALEGGVLAMGLLAIRAVGGTVVKWRRTGGLDELKLLPLSSAQITLGVLLPTVVGTALLWLVFVSLLALYPPWVFTEMNWGSTEPYRVHQDSLWMSVFAVIAQVLLSAVAALWFGLRRETVLGAFGWPIILTLFIPYWILNLMVPTCIFGGPPRYIYLMEAEALLVAPFKLFAALLWITLSVVRMKRLINSE